jgi:hypothetical protein
MTAVMPVTAALAAFGAILAVLRRNWDAIGSTAAMRGLSAAALLGILVSGAIHRFADVDHLLWASDEMVTLLAGIRLHLLPWWNLGAEARENFFKSLVMPIHGFGDNVFFYLVVALLRLLRLPITEASLFTAGAALAMATLALLFLLVRRLFGTAAAMTALALAAWNQALIDFSVKGFQMNFIVFLQVASIFTYLLHASRNRWSWSALMALLMALCAGSELFYFGPLFLLLHATRRAAWQAEGAAPGRYVRPLDRKSLVVWSAYGLVLLLNVWLFFLVGRRIPLTLFGQLAVKRGLGTAWVPDYGLDDFARAFDAVMGELPHATVVTAIAVIWLLARNRRSPYARFFSLSMTGLAVLAVMMKLVLHPNLMHLVLPAIIVVSVAATQAVGWLMGRVGRLRAAAREWPGLVCVAVVIPLAAPWRVIPWDQPAEPYRCIKAVGYALRELGGPAMDVRIMFLSDHAYIPPTMEYYTGLCASQDDDEPTRIFHARQATEAYVPSRIARRLGIERFDFYVEFVKERFPLKAALLADLEPLGLHEAYRIEDGGEPCAVISSPRRLARRVLSVEEGNRGFDATYAYWERLFHSRNVGAFWYYDANY